MLALISPEENNRIAQVESADFPVAEPLFWIECPDNVTPHWSYVDGQFVEPTPIVDEPVVIDPVEKLKEFLASNPDVAAIL